MTVRRARRGDGGWVAQGMNWSKAALFGSGVFAGGALDHLVLVALRRKTTPYGVHAGIAGNLSLAALDAGIALLLLLLLRRSR